MSKQVYTAYPEPHSEKILCFYANTTSHIQIIKINNIANFCFERVVFPGQRLLFEALSNALLVIYTGEVTNAIVKDRIPCDRLQVQPQEALV